MAEAAVEQGLLGPDPLGADRDERPRLPEKYSLERCLGSGGAGVVWLARDRALDRQVAIKILHPSRGGMLPRFRREARFTARLSSPSIVEVYELGEHDGAPYIAMRYVDGGNLAEAALELRPLLRVAGEVARALQYAHEQGIVHRDIKPANILLDTGGRPVLTDFGIALDLWADPGSTLSQDGQIMGTPGAMAPEQARGELHAVDARSDVYALGATLYRQLCGRWPFTGDSVVDVLHAVLHDDPPLPRSLVPELPREVEELLLRCLQKDRADRYSSMAALAEELERLVAGQRVAEGGAWFKRLVRPSARVAGEAREPAGTDPYWILGMEASRQIAAWDADLYRVSRNLPRLYPALDALIARLDQHLAAHPDAAWARYYRGLARLRRGRLAEALEDVERSVDRVGHRAGAFFELGRLHLAIFLREHGQARKHFAETGMREHLSSVGGRLVQAAQAFREALGMRGELPRWQLLFADAVSRLAEDDFAGCVGACDQILDEDPDVAEAWKLRGDALAFAGEEPFESWARALEIRRSFWEVWLAEAEERRKRGELARAAECVERALEVHPELVDALVLGARLLLSDGREGLERLDEGLELARRGVELDPEHYEARVTHAELALERARRAGEEGGLELALAELAAAERLDGCRNRVEFLEASARLERARQRRARGLDASADLEHVLAFRGKPTVELPDAAPWRELIAEAERELA